MTRTSEYFHSLPDGRRACGEFVPGMLARAVRPPRLAPHRTDPAGGLAQHLVPGDGLVVRQLEIGRRMHAVDHAVVHIADHVAVEGDAGDGGEKRLGHRMRHVDGFVSPHSATM